MNIHNHIFPICLKSYQNKPKRPIFNSIMSTILHIYIFVTSVTILQLFVST